jgi:putative hemolysin
VATTRLLDHQAASSLGRFYSEEEFSLHGLLQLQGPILELGRTCRPDYRNGTIAVNWPKGAQRRPLQLPDGLRQHPHAGWRRAGPCDHAAPARPLPVHRTPACRTEEPAAGLDIPGNVITEMPPLLKAYMRLGAKICGEPCWDEDFQVADVFILLKRDDLCPRYARHFKAAV